MGRRYLNNFREYHSRTILMGCVAALVVSLCTTASRVSAEDQPGAAPGTPPPAAKPADKAAEEKKETVKTGVIASQVKTGSFATVAVDADTSNANGSPGEESNVISGSVVRSGNDKCIARITNNGKNSYSVSFAVEGTNARGGKVMNQYFSATLKPKETVEKTVSRCDKDLNLAVNLKSARALK